MIKYQHFKILAVGGLHITKMSVLSLEETLLLLSVTAATFSFMIGNFSWIPKFSISNFTESSVSLPWANAMKVFSGWGGRTQPGSRGSGFVFQALSVWHILFLLHGPANKLVKDTQFSDDDVRRTDGDRVFGQWAGFGLLQFFIVQMKRVNIILLDRAAWKGGCVLARNYHWIGIYRLCSVNSATSSDSFGYD